jgi:hypothetical protein
MHDLAVQAAKLASVVETMHLPTGYPPDDVAPPPRVS